MIDTASKKVLKSQLAKEQKFLQRARALSLSEWILTDSQRRIDRYRKRLKNDAD